MHHYEYIWPLSITLWSSQGRRADTARVLALCDDSAYANAAERLLGYWRTWGYWHRARPWIQVAFFSNRVISRYRECKLKIFTAWKTRLNRLLYLKHAAQGLKNVNRFFTCLVLWARKSSLAEKLKAPMQKLPYLRTFCWRWTKPSKRPPILPIWRHEDGDLLKNEAASKSAIFSFDYVSMGCKTPAWFRRRHF